MNYEVIATFRVRATDELVHPGTPCPDLDSDTVARLIRARCLRPLLAPAAPPPADDDAPPEPPPAETETDGLDRLRVADLRELAGKRGLDVPSGAKKAEIIAALRLSAGGE